MRKTSLIAAVVLAGLSIAASGLVRDLNRGTAGEGFTYRSVSFRSDGSYTEILGEMTNRTGKDFSSTMFDLTLYDSRNNVIGVENIVINNFKNVSTRPIQGMTDVRPSDISAFKIDYSLGIE